MPKVEAEIVSVAGRDVPVSNPAKVLFPDAGHTKLDLVRYYLAVAPGALRAAGNRPNVLVRYPNGIDGESFYQKRAPESRPDWIDVVALQFPSGRTAEEVVPRDAAALVWMANLACLELHPHPVKDDDLDHPDELRIDLDPVPGVEWPQIRSVAQIVRATLAEFGLVGWPKTSGSRGMHIYVRIERRWEFAKVRRAALAFAREVERRAPDLATSKWWKEERRGVFLDYNQNAKDRTIAAAYSVRPRPDARVSAPLTWDEVEASEPGDFTLTTMPKRFAELGDPHAAMDEHVGSIDVLLDLSARQESEGLGRRAVAAALSQAAGRGSARRAITATRARSSTDRNWTGTERAGRPRRSRSLEGPTPGGERTSAGRRRAGGPDAWTLPDLDAHPRQPAARPSSAPTRAGTSRSRRRHGGRLEERHGRRPMAPKTFSSS